MTASPSGDGPTDVFVEPKAAEPVRRRALARFARRRKPVAEGALTRPTPSTGKSAPERSRASSPSGSRDPLGAFLGRIFAFPNVAARIVAVNMGVLALIVVSVLVLIQYRGTLIDQRLASLETEARLIAVSIAEAAGDPARQEYRQIEANRVLRRLSLPTGLRAQIFDRQGRLTGDTRTLLRYEASIEVEDLESAGPIGALGRRLKDLYDRVASPFVPKPELYQETAVAGISRNPLVYTALRGEIQSDERVNSENELIISVGVPVQGVRTVLGALVLSTEGGDIDKVAAEDRIKLLYFFAVAAGGMILVSLALAGTIARPIQKLAEAAEGNTEIGSKPMDGGALDIPTFPHRRDEIAGLSVALRRMTTALYDRIGAIERFAADVAHEIKNPLTSLNSAVEVLQSARTDEQRAKLFDVIKHDVGRLDRLVTDIANASRLDADLVREQRTRFDMRGLLATVVDIARPVAGSRGVTVSLDAPPPGVLPPAQGLENRLAQVFHNLIDNAISFSPEGGVVTVSAERDRLEGRAAILIEVADEGPGVPEENLESIFERFYSSRPDTEAFGDHSGLGLSICRQIVEAHGGRIWAQNRSDRPGAMFLALLPI